MFDSFQLLIYLCVLNCMFFISQILQFIFLRKIGRTYNFPTISFFTDLLLMIISIFTIQWVFTSVNRGVFVEGITTEEKHLRKVANLMENADFKFEYLFSGMIACLIWKILEIVQFVSDIGPLMMIVQKMMGDFTNFIILYAILLIMFSIVGNINFVFDLKEFSGLFESCLTVLDASIGNYDFNLFKTIRNNDFLVIFGDVFIMAIVITFNILILNLIIAILSNTYNMFDTKSTGLYLSKILNARDDMTYDPNYGAFLLIMAPLNIIVMPFVPLALFKKPSERTSIAITVLQYSVFIVIIYAVFLLGSIIMLPFAFLKSLMNKF